MSISRDFERYYGGTFVKAIVRGDILPFYVEGVSYNGPDGHRQYLEENLHHLRFHGILCNRNGERSEVIKSYNDLVLDNPEIGYVVAQNGTPVWLTYMTQRAMVKGLNRHRVNRGNVISWETVQQIFDREKEAEKLCDIHFFRHNNVLLYKGMTIGEVANGNVTLEPQFQYLAADATRLFG